MLTEKIKLFENNQFLLDGKKHIVKSVKIIQLKAIIMTDRQTFAKYESELDEMLDRVEFVDYANEVATYVPPTAPAVIRYDIPPFVDEMNKRADRVSEKLEEMFNKLSVDSSDENLKQSLAMVSLSNAIVQVEMVRVRCLQVAKA